MFEVMAPDGAIFFALTIQPKPLTDNNKWPMKMCFRFQESGSAFTLKHQTSNLKPYYHLTVLRIDNFGESGIFFVNIVVIVRLKDEVTIHAA